MDRAGHYQAINSIHQVDLSLKTPIILLHLGAALDRAKCDLGGGYQGLRDSLRCLRHHSDFNQKLTRDKDTRLMRFAAIKICWAHHAQIPPLGWSLCRQMSCLCPNGDETFLANLFKTGAIRPSMTREQLDALRSLMRSTLIAPRH